MGKVMNLLSYWPRKSEMGFQNFLCQAWAISLCQLLLKVAQRTPVSEWPGACQNPWDPSQSSLTLFQTWSKGEMIPILWSTASPLCLPGNPGWGQRGTSHFIPLPEAFQGRCFSLASKEAAVLQEQELPQLTHLCRKQHNKIPSV